MKRALCMLALIAVVAALSFTPPVQAGALQELFESLRKAVGGRAGLSSREIVAGLKEALQIGTQNAIAAVSRTDGYYRNADIRIALPESVGNAERMLRYAGFGSTVDRFEMSMNRAAEAAAPRAKPIFLDAVAQMTFSDAGRILDGSEDAAPRSFQLKTAPQLQALFKPAVAGAMAEVGVTRTYRQLEDALQTIPAAQSVVFDLDQYVTEKAVDGLFVMLAKEEAAIRRDPAARVTERLQKVFGYRAKK